MKGDQMDSKTRSILKDARHAILWLSNPQLRRVDETNLPRTDIVEAIDALLEDNPEEARHEALAAFRAADDAWGDALYAAFGKRAGDVRYTPAGKGEEGSELRRLYKVRDAAHIAWDRAYGLDENGSPLPTGGD
jgi:hypothetical protein